MTLQEATSSRPEPGPALHSSTFEAAGVAMTLAVPIRAGVVDDLETYLRSLDKGGPNRRDFRFEDLRNVHFMRWVVIRNAPVSKAHYLFLESNYDGSRDDHLRELVRADAGALHKIYSFCEGHQTSFDTSHLIAFLKRHEISYNAYHRGYPGKPAQRVRQQDLLRRTLQEHLDKHGERLRKAPTTEIYRELRERAIDLLEPKHKPEPFPESSKFAAIWRIFLGPSQLTLLFTSPLWIPLLLAKEKREYEWRPGDGHASDHETIPELKGQEDQDIQNQLTHVVAVKPGVLRRFLLRQALRAVNIIMHRYCTDGRLGGITSVHFARWVFFEKENLLVFFSNYDGSWESYLGDFVDIAARYVTMIWCNTEGFPRTRLLGFLKGPDADLFKQWTRAHQVYTEVWHSANPGLTVRNVLQNSEIARGLYSEPRDDAARRAWLALL